MNKKKLTIGIATYNDYDGLYFTIMSAKLYHPFVQTDQVEFVVIDNDPDGPAGEAAEILVKKVGGTYVPMRDKTSTTVKWLIPEYAQGEYILIIDSHVLLYPGSIDALMNYFEQCDDCKDLVQGPLLYDDLKTVSTSFKAGWGSHMYGKWHFDKEEYEKGEPFEIPMNGAGLFAFKRSNFPVLNKDFRGFGCEEWYIHEKFRRNGGKVMCLPQLKWMHRFKRPNGVPYPLTLEDKVWNYYIGWLELYDINDPMMQEMYNYLVTQIKPRTLERIKKEALQYHEKLRAVK
jgi:hypothetical protein